MDPMWSAVLEFGDERLDQLCRKVVWSMQRLPATGAFPMPFRTVWDEYCFEIQDGPHGELAAVFEWDERSWCRAKIDVLTSAEKKLLFYCTDAFVHLDEEEADRGSHVDDEALCDELIVHLRRMASVRSLQQFVD